MEAQATPQPQGPRNLAPYVAAWLRKLGFTVLEREYPAIVTVEAQWTAPNGKQFYLSYYWYPAPHYKAVLELCMYQAGASLPLDLIRGQHVRRLKEVRQLLLNDTDYRDARQPQQAALVAAGL